MSGDWIKMRCDLRTHPKVVRMASALRADKLRVVGGLFAVWSIFDAHSTDGVLDGYTFRAIDDELGWKGFGQAMHAIDWLVEELSGLRMPEFDEHNGQSAKVRAQDAKRKRIERETGQREDDPPDKRHTKGRTNVRIEAGQKTDTARTREEKRSVLPTGVPTPTVEASVVDKSTPDGDKSPDNQRLNGDFNGFVMPPRGWHKTNDGIEKAAQQTLTPTRPGELHGQLKERIFERIGEFERAKMHGTVRHLTGGQAEANRRQ